MRSVTTAFALAVLFLISGSNSFGYFGDPTSWDVLDIDYGSNPGKDGN